MSNHYSTVTRDEMVSKNGAVRPTVTRMDKFGNWLGGVGRVIRGGAVLYEDVQTTLRRPNPDYKTTENLPTGAEFRRSSPGVPDKFTGFKSGATTLLILGAVVSLLFLGVSLYKR